MNDPTEVKYLTDMGIERDFLESDEVSDLLPRNIFSSEDIEDAFDFLSESDIDIDEIIQEKAESREEERPDGERLKDPLQRETANAIWAYLKDIGRISLLSPDEEYEIAKKIEEGDQKAKIILFDLPRQSTNSWR